MVRARYLAAVVACGLACSGAAAAADGKKADDGSRRAVIERGRYMMIVGSCNDCHTAGFAPSEGRVPEKEWLLGSGPLGFNGPWGTTYAPNLRATAARMTETQWLRFVKDLKTRPPMPWFNLAQWRDSDIKALYHYIRQLGPVGDATTKAALPPDQPPPVPYIKWPAPPKP